LSSNYLPLPACFTFSDTNRAKSRHFLAFGTALVLDAGNFWELGSERSRLLIDVPRASGCEFSGAEREELFSAAARGIEA
jgi:hypothetical protein